MIEVIALAVGTEEADGSRHGIPKIGLSLEVVAEVGELESSKSAMNTLAPEFRALMIILRSTGPVIRPRWLEQVVRNGERPSICVVDVCRFGRNPAKRRAISISR